MTIRQRLSRLDWTLIRGSALISIGMILGRILGFGFRFVLARAFTPEEFGGIEYSIAVGGVLAIGTQPFAQHVLARFIGKHREDAGRLGETSTAAWLILGALTVVTLITSVPLLLALGKFNLGIVAVFVGTTLFYSYWGLSRGFLASGRLVAAYLGSNIVQLVLVILLVNVGGHRSPLLATSIFGLSYILPLLLLQVFVPLPLNFRAASANKTALRELAAFSVPIWLSHAGYMVHSTGDTILLEAFSDDASLGVYMLAKTLSLVFLFIPDGISTLLMPMVASQPGRKHGALLRSTVIGTLVINAAVLAAYLIFGQWLIQTYIGVRYVPELSVFLILSIAMMIMGAHNLITAFFVGSGKASFETISRLAGAVVMLVAGLLLVPTEGPLGAAVTVLLAAILAQVTYIAILLSERRKAVQQPGIASSPVDSSQQAVSGNNAGLAVPAARRVLIVVENSYLPRDVRVLYEARTLREAGWHVTVLCPLGEEHRSSTSSARAASPEPEEYEGFTVYRFPLPKAEDGVLAYASEYASAFRWVARLSKKVWRQAGFDVLHFCNPPDIFFPLALLYRLRGVRIIFDHHDLFPEMICSRYGGLIRRALYGTARIMEFLTYQAAHIAISTNQSYRQVAVTRNGKKPDRVYVVRNGPMSSDFVPLDPDPGLKQGAAHVVCYAGVMGPEDGITELAGSIRHIVQDLGRDDILFILLGDGAMRSYVREQFEAWGISRSVSLPGMVDRSVLRTYLSTADVLVAPEPLNALNEKSTFIKVAEYMAMGKPVVAYDLTETRYTAREAAVYVKPGDVEGFGQAVVDLLEDPARRQHMGQYGLQRVLDELCWERQQEILLKAYNAALSL